MYMSCDVLQVRPGANESQIKPNNQKWTPYSNPFGFQLPIVAVMLCHTSNLG